jgi:class 3 adenylate cyclase
MTRSSAPWSTSVGTRAQARQTTSLLGHFSEDEADAFIDYIRYGSSPGTLEALIRMNREIDIRHVLPAVRVPTLVLHGADDRVIPLEAARYLVDRIPGARLVEVPGAGHLAIGEDAQRINDEVQRFLRSVWDAGVWDEAEPDRVLATVLFTDIVDSTATALSLGDRRWREMLEQHHAVVRRELLRFRGREIDTAGDGFLAAFDGPARAIRCARAVVDALGTLGLEVRAGLHTGECELVDGKMAGIAIHTGARVAASAQPGEVLVSSTVKDLVAGSGIAFDERGAHALRGIPGEWQLFAVRPESA